MSLDIQGSLPASLAASILLLTKARRFGFRLNVAIVRQNAVQFTPKVVLFRDPLLVGLGVSSSDLDPSIVLTKGDCNEPLWVRVENHWISIDRSGRGLKPQTQELIGLFQSYDREKMHIAQTIRFAAWKLGVELEPSIIDLFFQSATLEQGLLLILQIGRTLSGSSGDSISESLFKASGEVQTKILSRLLALQDAFAKVGCHALSDWMKQQMPSLKELRPQILMMSLHPDIVGLKRTFIEGLGSIGPFVDPVEQMLSRFKFLGGNIISSSTSVINLSNTPFPSDPFLQWDWLSSEAERGSESVEDIWRGHCDPSQ